MNTLEGTQKDYARSLRQLSKSERNKWYRIFLDSRLHDLGNAVKAIANLTCDDSKTEVVRTSEELEKRVNANPPDKQAEVRRQEIENLESFIQRLETTRCLYGGLAVAIVAVIENHLKTICHVHGLPLKKKLPNWGCYRNQIEPLVNEIIKDAFKEFPKLWEVESIRLLANSFKHNDGFPKGELLKHDSTQYKAEQKIDFEKHPWQESIAYVRTFLIALNESLPEISQIK